jgi:hypothetical protein
VNSSVDVLISYAREDGELAGSLAGLIEGQRCVRRANVEPDYLEPSVDDLRDAVSDSIGTNDEIEAIVQDLHHTVPRIKMLAGTTSLAQLDIVLDEVHATV